MALFQRQIRIINSLIKDEKPVSGHIIGKECGLSLNTLKKEIELLNNTISSNGFRIVSWLSKGYQIEIIDPIRYEQFKKKFITMVNSVSFFKTERKARIHFIVRQLLFSNDKLTIQDFAAKCMSSVSVINRDMVEVRKILKQFDLTLENHTNNGLAVGGNEWNKRILLINEMRILKNYKNHLYLDQDSYMISLFLKDKEAHQKIRAIVLEELNRFQFFIPYHNLDKIVFMVLLNTVRNNQNSNLYFSRKIEVNHSIEITRQLAHNILIKVGQFYCIQYTEKEVLAISILLNCFRTINEENYFQYPFHDQVTRISKQCIEYIKKRFHLNQYNLPCFEKEFKYGMMSFCLYEQMKMHEDVDAVCKYQNNLYLNNFCFALYEYCKEKTAYFFNIYDILRFYPIFGNMLMEINKQIRKKVLVISKDGMAQAQYLSNLLGKLNTVYDVQFIPTEYISNQFQKRDYDFIVTDISKDDFSKNLNQIIKIRSYSILPDKKIFIQKFNKPYYLFEISEIFKKEDIHFLKNVDKKEDVFDYIEQNLLKSYKNVHHYVEQCKKIIEVMKTERGNQVIVFHNVDDFIEETLLKIIVLDKPIKWIDELCSLIILVNIKKSDVLLSQYLCMKIEKIIQEKSLSCDKRKEISYK